MPAVAKLGVLSGHLEPADARRVRRRVVALVLPWLVAFAIGFPLLWVEVQNAIQGPLRQDRADTLQESDEILRRALESLRRDAVFLTDLFTQVPRQDLSETSVAATLFHSFAASARYYTQVRWIDEFGNERLRINTRDGPPEFVPAEELQNKRNRPFVRDALNLPRGSIVFSALDLNVEHGVVERPLDPTLRVVSPVVDGGVNHGVIVINYRATRLLDRLAAIGNAQGIDVYLVNQAGYWLLGPKPDLAWAWQLGAAQKTLANDYPRLAQAMQSQDRGELEDADGQWAFRTFRPSFEAPLVNIAARVLADEMAMKIVVRIAPERMSSMAWRWKLILGSLMTAAVVVVLVYGWHTGRGLVAEERRRRELAIANKALTETNRNLLVVQADLARAERLSSLGMMVAGVAHELNTPLGSASLALSTVRKSLSQLKQRIEAGLRKSDLEQFVEGSDDGLDIAQTAVRRSSGIVQRFKQVAVDRTSMDRRRFDLAEIILDADPRLRRWDKASPITLRLDLAAGLTMDSYPGPLEQVISNLLDNALKHGFGSDRHTGSIRIRTFADGESDVVIEVSDDGAGIPEHFLKHIFDPFFTTSRHAGGTGLGLHIVFQLVTEVLGGTIKVGNLRGELRGGSGGESAGDSTAGGLAGNPIAQRSGGAVFTLRLPRSPSIGLDPANGARGS